MCRPGANVGKIVAKAPKLLLKSPEAVSAEALVVSRGSRALGP